MCFLFLILFILICPLPSPAQDSLRVLFLGNSYTAFNNLPQLFTDLSASGGKTVVYSGNAPGGCWLEDHLADSQSLRLIELGDWDYVVLQEQSQVPAIDYWRYNSMYPSADTLDSLIEITGARTCFFMTWGREFGGQQTIGSYSSPVFVDFFHMQDSLASAYSEIAAILNAELCPAGLAWAQAVTLDPLIDLWTEDSSHPTLLGSYLTACAFYGTLWDESPVGLSFTAGIDPDTAAFLQYAAQLALPVENQLKIKNDELKIENCPNPFNSSTTITFSIPTASQVEIAVYDNLGREITRLETRDLRPGTNKVVWNAERCASGVYFIRLMVDGRWSIVEKVVLMK